MDLQDRLHRLVPALSSERLQQLTQAKQKDIQQTQEYLRTLTVELASSLNQEKVNLKE